MNRKNSGGEIAIENVAVKIMGRDYVFACSPDERDSLMKCVALVDEKMSTIRAMGKLGSIERIAVMAALMISNELIALRDTNRTETSSETLSIEDASSRMHELSDEIRAFVDGSSMMSTNDSYQLL